MCYKMLHSYVLHLSSVDPGVNGKIKQFAYWNHAEEKALLL